MNYKLTFQYKSPTSKRPEDYSLGREYLFENGHPPLLPDVGDSIHITDEDAAHMQGEYKVLTRHFHYWNGWCYINIVVTNLSDEEYAARIKM